MRRAERAGLMLVGTGSARSLFAVRGGRREPRIRAAAYLIPAVGTKS